MGGIGALYPFSSREDADFFTHLEMHLRQEHPPLCGRCVYGYVIGCYWVCVLCFYEHVLCVFALGYCLRVLLSRPLRQVYFFNCFQKVTYL